jgi:lipid-binding SYLF domain-containing protein
VSVGFQAGAQSKAVVLLFMTKDALDKFRNSKGWTAGVDGSVALLKVGANGEIDTTTANNPVQALVLTNAGLMANLNLEGTKISKLEL